MLAICKYFNYYDNRRADCFGYIFIQIIAILFHSFAVQLAFNSDSVRSQNA